MLCLYMRGFREAVSVAVWGPCGWSVLRAGPPPRRRGVGAPAVQRVDRCTLCPLRVSREGREGAGWCVERRVPIKTYANGILASASAPSLYQPSASSAAAKAQVGQRAAVRLAVADGVTRMPW